MTKELLIAMTEDEVFDFIRQRLSFKNISSELRYIDKEFFEKVKIKLSGEYVII